MHPFKRRKIDAAVHASLSKPFRSPLRGRRGDNNAGAAAAARRLHAPADADTRTVPAAPALDDVSEASTAVSRQETAGSLLTHGTAEHHHRRRHASFGDIDALQKQYTTLSRQLTLLRQSLDTVQQALKIHTAGQSADLDRLIAKWRSVVRDTADELFDEAKRRHDDEGETYFTLDKMLRQMNVDLDLVGYDEEEQRWRDEV